MVQQWDAGLKTLETGTNIPQTLHHTHVETMILGGLVGFGDVEFCQIFSAQIFEAFKTDNVVILVLEFCEHGDLFEYMQKRCAIHYDVLPIRASEVSEGVHRFHHCRSVAFLACDAAFFT